MKRLRVMHLNIQALLTLWVIMITPGVVRSEPAEYLLKAGFLEKFARFTDWPEQSDLVRNPQKPFVLSVIGESPFGASLEMIYTKGEIKDRSVQIRYITDLWQIDGSDMLFISSSEDENLESILGYVYQKPILVVGDTESYGERGCHINLYITDSQTLHFEINLNTVKLSGLHLQLLLLEYGKVLQ